HRKLSEKKVVIVVNGVGLLLGFITIQMFQRMFGGGTIGAGVLLIITQETVKNRMHTQNVGLIL
ncbi:hypothetical protein, partial [Streptococcus suis]|uniref:hypothetical protein n=1 Tax=Streptococcus suis TaxID=1307 RepID=UPI001EE703B3